MALCHIVKGKQMQYQRLCHEKLGLPKIGVGRAYSIVLKINGREKKKMTLDFVSIARHGTICYKETSNLQGIEVNSTFQNTPECN